MSISIWEKTSYYRDRNFIVVGAGFTGLWTALELKKEYPEKSVLVLEKNHIPQGASSRNAGFACFGSMSELWEDAQIMGWDASLALVEHRLKGLNKIRSYFPAEIIDFEMCGGYELIDTYFAENHLVEVNGKIAEITGTSETFSFIPEKKAQFGIDYDGSVLYNAQEGYLHPGKLLQSLTAECQKMGIEFLFGNELLAIQDSTSAVNLQTTACHLRCQTLILCTNAYTGQLLPEIDLLPARGQILLTEPIPSLKIKGAFHFDRGYCYFRDWQGRLLLGGARNLNKKAETSLDLVTTSEIQSHLEKFLQEVLLPNQQVKIAHRWSGIMAMGSTKSPIVQQFSENIYGGVRLSGMGVALAPIIAEKIISLLT
ncbi:MAG: FAD-binding oxidoreductase [Weeksellaceae bacterium]|nr:FAD-binding oxidoreductase [Weeksellaceae bacterium]